MSTRYSPSPTLRSTQMREATEGGFEGGVPTLGRGLVSLDSSLEHLGAGHKRFY